MTPAQLTFLESDTADYFRQTGITYWQKLIREGVPREEAGKIAAAIAKFDLFARTPSSEQKRLISQFSPLVCRAQLWRSHLLL
ncbi:MAG: hypothetical protein F6K42_08835 [Leptolyngbya sp. SIO1D8]|nr:hypothetical protein [Leptolyngbya sp. SIO1D8]